MTILLEEREIHHGHSKEREKKHQLRLGYKVLHQAKKQHGRQSTVAALPLSFVQRGTTLEHNLQGCSRGRGTRLVFFSFSMTNQAGTFTILKAMFIVTTPLSLYTYINKYPLVMNSNLVG